MGETKNISADLERFYNKLDDELTVLHLKWNTFEQLFNRNEDRIEILNQTAPQFFVLVQNILISDLQLSICKLTEKHEKGGNKNLSLQVLIKNLSSEHQDLGKELATIFTELREQTKGFRDSRNKVIGHLDFDVFKRKKVPELTSFKIDEIEKTLELSRDFMNQFSSHFFDSHTYYEEPMSMGDGDALIENLKRALRHEELIKNKKIEFYSLSNSKYKNA